MQLLAHDFLFELVSAEHPHFPYVVPENEVKEGVLKGTGPP